MTVKITDENVTLLPCPFCGGESIDPTFWAGSDYSGPGCDDCGATAETPEKWNVRATPTASGSDAVAGEADEWDRLIIGAMGWHPSENGPSYGETRKDLMTRLATLRASDAGATGGEPVAWQFRQRSAVGKGPQSQLPWCDWCGIEREDYERYIREPNPLVQVRPLYATPHEPTP